MSARWSTDRTVKVTIGLGLWLAVPWVIAQFFADDANLGQRRFVAWLLTIAILLVTLVFLGNGISQRWAGMLINKENRFSLTNLQIAAWTLVLAPAINVAAAFNALGDTRRPTADRLSTAFDFTIPSEVWILLGINIATLAGTSIVLGHKTDDRNGVPTDRALADAGLGIESRSESGSWNTTFVDSSRAPRSANRVVQVRGVAQANLSPLDAQWSELFDGSEIGNFQYVDVGKVQMLLISGIVIIGYALLLGSTFAAKDLPVFSGFPTFSQGLLALIAVSHAGYIANLAAPHTDSERG
jgi:hypothetical protein